MSSINPETVVSVLKDQIENYDQKTEVKEEGRIIQIADGIATVSYTHLTLPTKLEV